MAYVTCAVANLTENVNGTLSCMNTAGANRWQTLNDAALDAIIDARINLTVPDSAFFQEALYNVDPLVVEAIFGGGLLLFVTGLGAGWAVHMIKQARL